MFNDIYASIHSDDLGPIIGDFHDNKVRSWDKLDSRARDIMLSQETVRESKGPAVVEDIYVAPPERIISTAEQDLEKAGRKCVRVSIEEARQLSAAGSFIVWRPNGSTQHDNEYCLMVAA